MSQPMNPYDTPDVRRPGMSGTAKVLLGLGVGCAVMAVLCCGFFGLSGYWFAKSMEHSISKDPDRIREVTGKIVSITIPERLPPLMSMDFDLPIANTNFMMWAQYGADETHNTLALAQFGVPIDEKNMQVQWRQSMRQSGRRDYDDIDIEQSERLEQEVNGETASFTVALGHSPNSQEHRWQVMGMFHGKGGPAMLFMQLNESDFSKEEVLEILKSMK